MKEEISMNILKRISKFIPVLAITMMMLCGNAFAGTQPIGWKLVQIIGVFLGYDPQGNILCGPSLNSFCFNDYVPIYGASTDPYDPFSGSRAIWIPSAGSGLIAINGLIMDSLSYGDVYTPITDEETQEVSSEQEVINWMNANYGQQLP